MSNLHITSGHCHHNWGDFTKLYSAQWGQARMSSHSITMCTIHWPLATAIRQNNIYISSIQTSTTKPKIVLYADYVLLLLQNPNQSLQRCFPPLSMATLMREDAGRNIAGSRSVTKWLFSVEVESQVVFARSVAVLLPLKVAHLKNWLHGLTSLRWSAVNLTLTYKQMYLILYGMSVIAPLVLPPPQPCGFSPPGSFVGLLCCRGLPLLAAMWDGRCSSVAGKRELDNPSSGLLNIWARRGDGEWKQRIQKLINAAYHIIDVTHRLSLMKGFLSHA